jgi:hypothetical protein
LLKNYYSLSHEGIIMNKELIGNKKIVSTIFVLGLLLFATFSIAVKEASAVGPATVPLGTARYFSVLAGSTVTNTGPTTITADVGLYPGSAISGFPPGVIFPGIMHIGDATAINAKADLTTAYNVAAGRASTATVSGDIGGLTLTPGVYTSASSLGLTGTLNLNGQGDSNSVFIFQIGSSLTTASSSTVVLTNGTKACNVFWQVGSSATLGTGSSFVGNILALTSITVTTGATVEGRVLARNGAVTLDTNTITTTDYQSIFLTPESATNPVGTNHTVTATVNGTGDPVPNALVTFNVVSGPNIGLTGSALTNSSGRASFTYMSILAGTDTIVASFVNSQGATVTSNQVTKTWTGTISDMTLALAPASSTNPSGTSHTVTVTVADEDDPVTGASVTFNVISGPNVGVTGSALTNSSGRASFTYTSNGLLGTDTIVASFVNSQGETVTSNQVTKTWITPPAPISMVGGEIVPLNVLPVLLSQYGAVIAVLAILLVSLGLVLVKKTKRNQA